MLVGNNKHSMMLLNIDTCVLPLQVFMLSADAVLNVDTLSELLASGHSRVPVFMPGDRCVVLKLLRAACCALTSDLLCTAHALK